MPFANEAERQAEGLRRELDKERETLRKTEAARERLEAELRSVRGELERSRTAVNRLRPSFQVPLGWFRMPVAAALLLVVLAVALLVGAVLTTMRSEERAGRLERERDTLARAANREAAARRAAETQAGPADIGCLSACGCPDGQGCVGDVCREGVSPAHCCDRPACPRGVPCQHWDGTEGVCGEPPAAGSR